MKSINFLVHPISSTKLSNISIKSFLVLESDTKFIFFINYFNFSLSTS